MADVADWRRHHAQHSIEISANFLVANGALIDTEMQHWTHQLWQETSQLDYLDTLHQVDARVTQRAQLCNTHALSNPQKGPHLCLANSALLSSAVGNRNTIRIHGSIEDTTESPEHHESEMSVQSHPGPPQQAVPSSLWEQSQRFELQSFIQRWQTEHVNSSIQQASLWLMLSCNADYTTCLQCIHASVQHQPYHQALQNITDFVTTLSKEHTERQAAEMFLGLVNLVLSSNSTAPVDEQDAAAASCMETELDELLDSDDFLSEVSKLLPDLAEPLTGHATVETVNH